MFGQQEQTSSVACGMMLLALYLVFDSFTSQWQSRMFTKHRVSKRHTLPCRTMLLVSRRSVGRRFVLLVVFDFVVRMGLFVVVVVAARAQVQKLSPNFLN